MEKRATIKDISAALGVSVTTVYKALNNKPKISESLRQEVLRVAEELNYKPNRAAQALSRKSVRIGAIIPGYPKTFYDYIADGIQVAFEEMEDYNVVGEIIRVNDTNEASRAWEHFYRSGVAGVVTAFNEFNTGCEDLQREYKNDISIMCMVSKPKDGTNVLGGVFIPADVLGSTAAEILSLSVLDKNKPLIVCIPDSNTNVHTESEVAFYEKCKELGNTNIKTYILDFTVENQRRVAEQILKDNPDVGGIYVGSNNSCELCKYFEKQGLSGKVKIVGHDLYPELVDCLKSGSLTVTLFQNPYDNARKAVKELVSYLTGEYTIFRDIIFRPEIVFRSNLEIYKNLY